MNLTKTSLRQGRSARSLLRAALLGASMLAVAGTALASPASAASTVAVDFVNTGCQTSTLTWNSPRGPLSYGSIAPGATKRILTFSTHSWTMKAGSLQVGSFVVGTGATRVPFDSFGCSTGTSRFQAAHSGKCLNVPSWSTATGARLIQYTCGTGQANESFTTVTAPGGVMIRNVNSGKCLTVRGASMSAGAIVVQQPCTYSSAQILAPQADSSLAFRHSGQCLDVSGAQTIDHVAITQWPCNGQSNQKWIRF